MTTKKDKAAARSRSGCKLTAKQQRFVGEYLIDLNATQAAIRAGYRASTAEQQGYQLLQKTSVQKAVRAAQARLSERTEITQNMVLLELARIGFSDIRKAVRWGNTELRVSAESGSSEVEAYHGLALKASDEIDDDTAAAIAEVSQGRDGLKIKLYDKKAALVDIGKHLGMFVERKEVRVGELERATNEELARKALVAAQQIAEIEGLPVESVLQQIQGASGTVH